MLLQNHEYEPAEVYLNSVSKQQTERLFLVNTHHSILDALFNTKASEAIQEGIEIDFRVNDLSMLPFEAADMVVLLSNLLDNAIEANRSYCGSKKIHVIALWKKAFYFLFETPQILSELKTTLFKRPNLTPNFMVLDFPM